MKTTLDVKTIALNRAIALLGSLGAQYKIILPDGAGEYGTLEVAAPSKPGAKYGYGVLREYVKLHMDSMKPGDVKAVPVDGFDFDSIQSSVANYAHKVWGHGSIVSTRQKALNVVEVLRVV